MATLDQARAHFDEVDRTISGWMHAHGHVLLRYALALVFIWFGALKPLGMSPAADLIANTVYFLPPEWVVPLLGWWEVAIGIVLLFRPLLRLALGLLFAQMVGTFMPLFMLPEVCFTEIPFGLTTEGQYIIKNLVIISAAIVVGGTVRRASTEKHRL